VFGKYEAVRTKQEVYHYFVVPQAKITQHCTKKKQAQSGTYIRPSPEFIREHKFGSCTKMPKEIEKKESVKKVAEEEKKVEEPVAV
jgi:hypothetical protein